MQVGRGGRSPEAAEASGCSWRVGNRFISPILLEIFSGYAAFPSFLGQLVQLLGLCGIKFHLLCWSILEGCPIRRADHDIQSALSGLRIAKVPAKPGAPGCGLRCGFPPSGHRLVSPGGLCPAGQAPRAGWAPGRRRLLWCVALEGGWRGS